MFLLRTSLYVASIMSASPTPIPGPDKGLWEKIYERGKVDQNSFNGSNADGWLAEEIKKALLQLGDWIKDGLIWCGESLFRLLDPFLSWGSRIIIVACFIIYFTSGDRKYISAGMKWAIIFLILCFLEGVIN